MKRGQRRLAMPIAAAAVALFAVGRLARGPASQEPVPAAVRPAGVAAVPAASTTPAATPVAAIVASAPPRAVAASAAAAAVQTVGIGSEGYGPHIESAFAGHDAAAAWEAVGWLRACASNDARRDSFERARALGVVPEMTTQLMVEADAEARRCQTVTAWHRALLPALAARAFQAGVPDAAAALAGTAFAAELSTAERQQMAEAMSRTPAPDR